MGDRRASDSAAKRADEQRRRAARHGRQVREAKREAKGAGPRTGGDGVRRDRRAGGGAEKKKRGEKRITGPSNKPGWATADEREAEREGREREREAARTRRADTTAAERGPRPSERRKMGGRGGER